MWFGGPSRNYYYFPSEVLIFTSRKRSLGQGNVLHLSVILFTRGLYVSQHAMGCTPPGQTPLTLRQTPLGRQPPLGRHPRERHTSQADIHPPRDGSWAGGTQPTGMHSCFFFGHRRIYFHMTKSLQSAQGSHFSGLTKFPDFSSIFFPIFHYFLLFCFLYWKFYPF